MGTTLLDLPPEILEMILLVLPPDSFSCMLMTCHSIRNAVLSTQKVLRTHLWNVPGLRPPDQASPSALLQAFNSRAAKSAWNGLETFADIVVHQPALPEHAFEPWTRPKFNSIQPCCAGTRGCDRGLLATAADYRGVIHVYRIRKGRISALCKLDPRTLGLEDGDEQFIQYRCIATRWTRCPSSNHSDHLVGLFSYHINRAHPRGKGEFAKSFISEAASKTAYTYHLICWKVNKLDTMPWASHEIVLPPGFEPKIFTLKTDSTKEQACTPAALVSWCPQLNCYSIAVLRIMANRKIHALDLKTSETTADESIGLKFSEPILRAEFTKGANPELWLYGADTAPLDNVTGINTISLGALRLANTVSTSRTTPYLFSTNAFPRCFKGIPIKANHDHECGTYDTGTKYCVQTVLELVVPRADKVSGAYLIKYAEEQDACSVFDLSMELPALEYTVVAKLLGSDYTLASPMGRIIALSPDKEWVAIAHWDSIKLWGIHTPAFFSPTVGSLLPNALQPSPLYGGSGLFTWREKQNRARKQELSVPDDKAYTTNCAQGYFHDHIRVKGEEKQRIVGIRPIELPRRGVVFSMAFSKHNTLWAWTDAGLVKWAWGSKRSGVRGCVPLPMVSDRLWGSV